MSDDGSDTSHTLDLVGEDGDFADWTEENEEARLTRCLFSSQTHASPAAALSHAASTFGFDLRVLYKQHGMEFYQVMQCLNYARWCTKEHVGDPPAAAAAAAAGIASGAHRDEKFLAPALTDDPLLFDWEDFVGVGIDNETVEDDQAAEAKARKMAEQGDELADNAQLAATLAVLRAENEALKMRVLEMSARLGESLTVDDAPTNVGASLGFVGDAVFGKEAPKTYPKPKRGSAPAKRNGDAPTSQSLIDDNYFGSYGYFDIHRTMLDDVARTAAYRVALEENPSCVHGKKVLDIGCGTGILSMFAARGGASEVVGIDGAADIAAVARANVKHNGFDGTIKIVQGKVEELLAQAGGVANDAGGTSTEEDTDPNASNQLQPHSFDVLVSEWMGYALLFESMFDTVILARDTLLKPGGAVLPDIATIHIAGFGRNATSLPFWDDVYGFEMPTVQSKLTSDEYLKTAVVAPVKGAHCVTSSREIKRLDLSTVSVNDLDFTCGTVTLVARSDGIRGDEHDKQVTAGAGEGATGLTQRSTIVDEDAAGPVMVHGVVLWFDTLFSERFSSEKPGVLSTSPHARGTHWAQTMLHFPEPIALWTGTDEDCVSSEKDAIGSVANPASSIKVRVGMAKCLEKERARALDISLEYTVVGADGAEGSKKVQIYRV
jgi:type I protein arginine methyltransferase